LTLTGPGGVGKTRLALAVAGATVNEFPDGVFVVPLAALTDPTLVGPTVAAALELQLVGSSDPVGLVGAFLGNRRALLLLDNFEQVADAASFVAGLLGHCPSLTVLVTSRVPLHLQAEQEFPVAPLSLPTATTAHVPDELERYDAIALFVRRARQRQPDFRLSTENAAAVVDVCHRLDGLPLAIELAAARLKLMSPGTLLTRLDRRLAVLKGGARDLPDRQRTMRATIAWSYDLLAPDERRVFRQLAVFAGGWTLEAAEAVCDPDLDVLEGLSTLVDHSLVRQSAQPDGATRFDILETIREFGLERLDAEAESSVARQRHADYFLRAFTPATLAFEAVDSGALERAEVEHDNVRSALGWAVEHDAAAIIRCLETFGVYLWRRGHFGEARRWLERALASGQPLSAAARASALHFLGMCATTQADYAEGRRCGEATLALYRELNDRSGMAGALWELGRVALFTGDHQRALQLFEEARSLLDDSGSSHGGVFANLSSAAIASGEYGRAATYLAEGLERARRFEDIAAITLHLELAAKLALRMDDTRRARDLLAESLTIHQRHAPERRYATQCLETCAWLAAVEGQPERAARLLGAVRRARQTMGVPVPPNIQAEYDRHLPQARTHIDATAWDRAWSEGEALTLEEAIVSALQDEPARVEAAAAVTSRLSPRELEVLRQLADGLSNQEIGAALFISPNTVSNHVTNILNKLGLDSRSAAVSYAVRHGLA
jgi:non-specific serine/threonine protein kinase